MKNTLLLKTGILLLATALTVQANVLLETDFSGADGPLAGREGWVGRDDAVHLDGKGLAGLSKPDGFVKRELPLPAGPERIRFTAQVKFSALAGSTMRRMQPGTDSTPGGIESIKIESDGGELAAPVGAQPPPVAKPGLPLGSRTNAEVQRGRELEARIDGAKSDAEVFAALREGWKNPPSSYRPHTRWWWPGNAVTKEGIDWQLEQMKEQGLGGVEIMSFSKVYDKGNIEFGTPEFFDIVHYTVTKAHELGMLVTPPLGPGWNHGHAWVPEPDRAKNLKVSEQEIRGGEAVEATLEPPKEFGEREKRIDAVVAVKLDDAGQPDFSQRVDLTALIKGARDYSAAPNNLVSADLPAGRWKIMGFWTGYTGEKCAAENNEPRSALVDHFDKEAVRRYVEFMGDRYRGLFGEHFGQTVDSFFGDSYELRQEDFFSSRDLFERFEKVKGYDLRPYLPLLKFDGAPETPYVRHDFNHFLHLLGMEAATDTLVDYCDEVGVQMRQQPHYRFPTEMIEASGRFQRPETENTKTSFDPMFWHKLAAAGADLYPSKDKRWVSAEAFTFINTKYRTTMEQIKRGTDLFLRDGITQFYNHGYFYTPEKELAPARDLIWMNRISHVNTWWPWYRGLADYQARASFLSRQGRPQSNVLVYSPMPSVWSERADFPVKHVRDLPFGNLMKTLIASGYDFACVNDDLLQHHSEVRDGQIIINGSSFSVLILPRVLFLTPETLAVLDRFVRSGGTVFALNTLPQQTTGLLEHAEREKQLAKMIEALFNTKGGEKAVGDGKTFFLPSCDGFDYLTKWAPGAVEWAATEPLSPAWAEFIAALRTRLTPDFEIADKPLSDGLTFRRTRIGGVDAWFITNLQPHATRTEVILNSKKHHAQIWNPMTGEINAVTKSRVTDDGRIALPVDLQPWESRFVLLSAQPDASLRPARELGPEKSYPVAGSWTVQFNGLGGAEKRIELAELADWTTLPGLRDFSGEAQYTLEFELPEDLSEPSHAMFLDLGKVHEVAHVHVNGKDAGKVWMQPQRVEVTGLLRPGKNTIQVTVANLLWNHAAGMKEPNPIPAELHAHYGTTWPEAYNGWGSLQTIKKNNKDDRLPSGLLGPVTLRTAAEISTQP